MYHEIIDATYALAQMMNFGAIIPVLRRVYASRTAEAISVPATTWYSVNGLIVTVYLVSHGCGTFIACITFVQLVVFNTSLAALAYYKQKTARQT